MGLDTPEKSDDRIFDEVSRFGVVSDKVSVLSIEVL